MNKKYQKDFYDYLGYVIAVILAILLLASPFWVFMLLKKSSENNNWNWLYGIGGWYIWKQYSKQKSPKQNDDHDGDENGEE